MSPRPSSRGPIEAARLLISPDSSCSRHRGHQAAAPLKRELDSGEIEYNSLSPRPSSRGPIEALPSDGSRQMQHGCHRGHQAAAPLKHLARAGIEPRHDRGHRGHQAAAPLKRAPTGHGEMSCRAGHRGHQAAAPLKPRLTVGLPFKWRRHRGHQAAAPLKHRYSRSSRPTVSPSPRPSSRGPIEAAYQRPSPLVPPGCHRGHQAAAPLKQGLWWAAVGCGRLVTAAIKPRPH